MILSKTETVMAEDKKDDKKGKEKPAANTFLLTTKGLRTFYGTEEQKPMSEIGKNFMSEFESLLAKKGGAKEEKEE